MNSSFKDIYKGFSSKNVKHVNFTAGLGLVILVISIFFGNFLSTQTKEMFIDAANKKTGNKCFDDCRKESGTKACNQECNTNYVPGVPDNDVVVGGKNKDNCPGNLWCEGCGGFCLSGNYQGGGCSNAQQQVCGQPVVHCDDSSKVAYDNDGDGIKDDFYCPDLSNVIPSNQSKVIYLCSPNKYKNCGNRCDASCYGRILNHVPNNFCGVIQVDQTSGCTGKGNAGTCNHISFFDNDCEHEEQPTSTPTVTSTPTSTPTVTSTPTGTPTSTPTSTPIVTSTPHPSGTPNYCGGTCGSNSNCQAGLSCNGGFCRNPECPGENDCNCGVSTPTPPPVLGVTAPPQLPKTGGEVGMTLSLFGIAALGVYIFKKFKLV